MQSHFWKTFLSLLGMIIGILIVIIGSMTLYFTWQLKYGDADTVRNIYNTYETKFSATSHKRIALNNVENYHEFIRPHNPTIGDPEAPITIIMFIDFECPYCQGQFETFNSIIKNYEPALYIVFKHLPLNSLHPRALDAAKASTCAAEQNKFWEYHDQLFVQKNLEQNNLYTIAQQINLNTTLFNTCFSKGTHDKKIEEDLEDAVTLNLRGTPTYIINGDIIEGGIPHDTWNEIILKHLNN